MEGEGHKETKNNIELKTERKDSVCGGNEENMCVCVFVHLGVHVSGEGVSVRLCLQISVSGKV